MALPAALIAAPLFEMGKTLIDRWFPDAEKKAAAEREFLMYTQDQDFKKVMAQLEINAREAAHPSLWVSGWRPYIGWGCGTGFLWATIGQSVAGWVAEINNWPAPPAVDTDVLLYVLGALLGIGGLRTYEKTKHVTK